MRYYIFSLFVIGYLSLATPVHAEKIMRWVDQNGVTHFATTPPNSQASVEEVHLPATNRADAPTVALDPSLRNAFAAIEQNKSTATRSDVVVKGAPKRVLTPAARPSSKRSNRRYGGRIR